MRRYLWILFGVLSIVACEPIQIVGGFVAYCFGPVEVTTTHNSATVEALKPYITIDGIRSENATIYLEYYAAGDSQNRDIVAQYTPSQSDDNIVFHIDGLQPDTRYEAQLFIDGGTYGSEHSDTFTFTTKEYTPTYESECSLHFDAKGVLAIFTIKDVVYKVNGESQDVERVTMKYKLKGANEWVRVDMTDRTSVTIPESKGLYLEENRVYIYCVTIEPANSDFVVLTSAESEFKTTYAEVTADIATPTVAIVEDSVNVAVESAKVLFDGVDIPDYPHVDYYIYYRKAGSKAWSNKVAVDGDNMSLALDVESLESGASYEFAGAVVAGAKSYEILSDVATITIANEETPPTPPTPPITGDADTSAIAGTWHLTEWRATTPPFDVYLSITDDGIVTLWQRIESRAWELYYSTVAYDNGTIAGQYSDGVAWGTSYTVALNGDTMTWIDTSDATEISVYRRCELPNEITTTQSESTRSADNRRFL